MEDNELKAMAEIAKVLAPIADADPAAADRILEWVTHRYGRVGGSRALVRSSFGSPQIAGGQSQQFETAAELLNAVDPKREYEKAIAIGYWFQVAQGQPDFTGHQVNTTLKNIGYQLKNITDAFNTAMNRRPALVLQTQKTGKSRQARKQYKLTTAGIQWVRERLIAVEGAAEQSSEDAA